MQSFDERHVDQAYRRYAPIYDLVFGGVLEGGRRRLAEQVRRLAPKRLLEVGVGTGLTLFDYPVDTEVVGVDLSEPMLMRAQQRARQLRERSVTLMLMNGESLAFADGTFDCVTLPYVLSVTPDPRRLVAEARRVCAPGGDLFIINHFSGSRFWRPLERLVGSAADRIGFRSNFDYAEHVLAHDWTVLSVRPVNLLGLSRLVHLRNAQAER